MTNILVTGASGFLGKALIKDLKSNKNNNKVIAVLRDNHLQDPDSYLSLPDHLVFGDITDYSFLTRVISEYEINIVYHLASQAIVRSCANDPMTAYEVNVMGAVKLLEAIRTVGMNTIESIIVSTSDKSFGHASVPYTENSPLMPKYTYESTKACQDIVAQNYFHNYGLPIKIVRCSNLYGPGDPNDSRLIPNTIKRINQGLSPQIYASVAEYIREFVYITDAVNAFTLVNEKANPGEIFCVGGTDKIKIKNLVQMILDLMYSDLKIVFPEKNSLFKEIEEQYIDASKLKRLGWNPKVSLKEGILNSIKYYGI